MDVTGFENKYPFTSTVSVDNVVSDQPWYYHRYTDDNELYISQVDIQCESKQNPP